MPKTKEAGAETPAVLEALRIIGAVGAAPDVHWLHGDAHCDCLFQQIAETANPYLGRTVRVRLCCIWADIFKAYPQFVQEMGYYDPNRHTYTSEPADWDSPHMDMPVPLWHRQLAIKEGKTVAQIRKEYAGRERERPTKVEERAVHAIDRATLLRAHTERLRAGGWLLDDEEMPDVLAQAVAPQPDAPVIP